VILYEHEAKALLSKHGVAVPAGALYPDVPEMPTPQAPLVAKAQLFEGKRGQRGGVHTVTTTDELAAAVARFRAGSELLPPAQVVLVETFIPGREFYLAVVVDRDAGVPVLLAGASGGVDIESQAGEVARFPLSILWDVLPDRLVAEVGAALDSTPTERLATFLQGMWRCFRDAECLLVEINPCVKTPVGELVALDAKINIDDNGRGLATPVGPAPGRTRFELECSTVGVSATELAGDIAIVVSGAGLAMATLDLVADLGGAAGCVVDLGYSTLQSGSELQRVFELVFELRCRVVLVNAFLQMASCAVLATSIAAAAKTCAGPSGAEPPGIVARLAGNDADSARATLTDTGGQLAASVVDACRAAVELSAAGGGR
jgi:succinyl-CoA synthetase beta subunit